MELSAPRTTEDSVLFAAEKDITVTHYDGGLQLQIDEPSIRTSYQNGILQIHVRMTDEQENRRTTPIIVGPRLASGKNTKHRSVSSM